MGWWDGVRLSGNIITWAGDRVQLQLTILPLLTTFVKGELEILVTGSRVNIRELYNCSLVFSLFSTCVLHHHRYYMIDTSICKNKICFTNCISDEMTDLVPQLGLFLIMGEHHNGQS
jgi:hypothetical protein